MTKFGIVFLVTLVGPAVLAMARSPSEESKRLAPGVAANRRLTQLVSGPLLLLLLAIAVTILFIQPLLTAHYVVGFLLIPPLMLKLATTGYRFGRYYTGSLRYRLAGAPPLLLRLSAPILVISTIAVFVSGVELWLFGLRFGTWWMPVHAATAVLMMLSAGVHLIGHFRQSAVALLEEFAREDSNGALSRRSLVVGSLVMGAVLAFASLFYPTPFPPTAAGP